MNQNIHQIESEIEELRSKLKNHELYSDLHDIEDIRIFMQGHVYAVWDFMSLLKFLQQRLTNTTLPWVPAERPSLARFINEIVLGEESDLDADGKPRSHFEMYLEAMEQVGADTAPITQMIEGIKKGKTPVDAIQELSLDTRVQDFVAYTFALIGGDQPHEVASAFTFGREDLIPDMFMQILAQSDPDNTEYSKLRYYLERHIELDGDEHGPLSLQMIAELCGDDSQKWQETLAVAKQALRHRIALWDAIAEQIKKQDMRSNECA